VTFVADPFRPVCGVPLIANDAVVDDVVKLTTDPYDVPFVLLATAQK
jgi:hypothetical protein